MKILYNLNQLPSQKRICIYGAGGAGIRLKQRLAIARPDLTIVNFADSFKKGAIDGVPIIPPAQLPLYEYPVEIIIASNFWKAILHDLQDLEVANLWVYSLDSKSQSLKDHGLDQETADAFLRCPHCHGNKCLELFPADELVCCTACKAEYPMRFGIPTLLSDQENAPFSETFLPHPAKTKEKTKRHNGQQQQLGLWRIFAGECIEFILALHFLGKFGISRLLRKEDWCDAFSTTFVTKKRYASLLAKSTELMAFRRMKDYIAGPSLEIGCGPCDTTNAIFRDEIDSVTFGCEYFMDTFAGPAEIGVSSEMYKVVQHYVGGSMQSLPFTSEVFRSVYSVHVIDHIVNLDVWFQECDRILQPGGSLIISGLARKVFDHLPGVKLRRKFSDSWAETYKEWRIEKENPRRPFREGRPFSSTGSYATGRNILSIEQWRKTAALFGFDLVDSVFFGSHYFSLFMDMEYRGYFPSLFSSGLIYSAIDKLVAWEQDNELVEEEATNILLVFKKSPSPPPSDSARDIPGIPEC